jgi:DNA-binding transcriptional ArsR family regulator
MLHLGRREATVGEVRGLFEMSHAAVTKHLKMLDGADLIRRRWSGRHCYISRVDVSLAAAQREIAKMRAPAGKKID